MSTSYLTTLNESLAVSKEMLRLLEFRVNHLEQRNAKTINIVSNPYEINENKITIIKTNAEAWRGTGRNVLQRKRPEGRRASRPTRWSGKKCVDILSGERKGGGLHPSDGGARGSHEGR